MSHLPAVFLETDPITLAELARAIGADEAWVLQLVEVDILHVEAAPSPPAQWRFRSADLARARAARALERDFGAGPDAAALILGLRDELRRLRALLAAHGLD